MNVNKLYPHIEGLLMTDSNYPPHANVHVLASLLKKFDISHVVISSGNRHTPLVNILENDDYFQCYSIVDERSAAFFAQGLIHILKKPVAIACTSGTSVCNYLSGAAEAHLQNLPLLLLTADRNPRFLYQVEQMIPQSEMTKAVCKKVELPFVKTPEDFFYCQRMVNEALLELNHHGTKPVNINYPIEFEGLTVEKVKEELTAKITGKEEKIPTVTKINRVESGAPAAVWEDIASGLLGKKIAVLYGQHDPHTEGELSVIKEFAERYNAVFISDVLSNLHCKGSVQTFLTTRLQPKTFDELKPDILITVNGNMMTDIRRRMGKFRSTLAHWSVRPDGKLIDPYNCLKTVFECSTQDFFTKILAAGKSDASAGEYLQNWETAVANIPANPEVPYSDTYIIQECLKNLPKNSLIHLANSTTIRVGATLSLDPSIDVYCNRGTNGIDGSVSTFAGQAAISGKTSFLIIGDLSFFYDMNGLWNRYVGKNVRILLNNNGCGEIFYYTGNIKSAGMLPNLHKHIGAVHDTEAKGWVESIGFKYLSARTKEEYDAALQEFLSEDSDCPIFLEVFTDKEVNTELMDAAYSGEKSMKGKVFSFGLKTLGLK